MWVSPNHPRHAELTAQRQAPAETGERIATFDRQAQGELRVNVAEYEGHPYVGIRVWKPAPDGVMLPDPRRGVSIKVRELRQLAAALAKAADRLEGAAKPQPRRKPSPWSKPKGPMPLRGLDGHSAGFDEFADG